MKVLSLEAEKLIRKALDYILYFEKFAFAQRLLNKAIKIYPEHPRAHSLKGDIYLLKGEVKKALKFYTKALEFDPKNPKILANIANCYDASQEYKLSLKYVNSAFSHMEERYTKIYPSIYEIKLNALIKLGKISLADKTLDASCKKLFQEDSEWLKTNFRPIIQNRLRNKKHSSGLKVVSGQF